MHTSGFSYLYLLSSLLIGLLLNGCSNSGGPAIAETFATKTELGQSLFNDVNLSLNRSQSCATCHNPEHAFIDDRLNSHGVISSVSTGDDGVSMGDRNTPTASYAAISPTFHHGEKARLNSKADDYTGYLGGQFLDGRAATLSDQAGGPPLNPIEMGMADKAAVVTRLQENQKYLDSFKALFDASIWDSTEAAYQAMQDSIEAFEKTATFSPFDSRYDRFLQGDYQYDPLSKAALGKSLFFSQQFTNCATCHQLRPNGHKQETFTSYEYHNIGVPINTQARAINGSDASTLDLGLGGHPDVADATLNGKFKVPTLRNIAVTEPYMHNGVFQELRTVIEFYDHWLPSSSRTLNPETGQEWRSPEVEENFNQEELVIGRVLSESEIDGLICFMRTLTDAKYEALIDNTNPVCEE